MHCSTNIDANDEIPGRCARWLLQLLQGRNVKKGEQNQANTDLLTDDGYNRLMQVAEHVRTLAAAEGVWIRGTTM